jgi:hypothetical protein
LSFRTAAAEAGDLADYINSASAQGIADRLQLSVALLETSSETPCHIVRIDWTKLHLH